MIFNEFYSICEQNNLNFKQIKEFMVLNGWINKMHTNVPGHDGRTGFGGMCFLKDIAALNEYAIRTKSLNEVINSTIKQNNMLRF